jgi:cobalt/nickel transport system permease protein
VSDWLHGDSFLDLLDDRARLLAGGLLLAGVAALTRLETAALGLGLALALLALTRTCPRRTARALRPLLFLLVPLLLLTPFHAPAGARPLVAGWGHGPTQEGARLAALVAVRVVALGILGVVVVGELPVARVLTAVGRLGVPAALTHVALLSHRYAASFGQDLTRIRWALAARGFRARTDLPTSRALATAAGTLLLRSLERTERVEQAMRCRGYAGRLATEAAPRPRLRDALALLAALGLAGGLHALERGLP